MDGHGPRFWEGVAAKMLAMGRVQTAVGLYIALLKYRQALGLPPYWPSLDEYMRRVREAEPLERQTKSKRAKPKSVPSKDKRSVACSVLAAFFKGVNHGQGKGRG